MSNVYQATAAMLREDKNVVIESLEVVTNPLGELETPDQIKGHIETWSGLVESWNENLKNTGWWSSDRGEYPAHRDDCVRQVAAFKASLAQPHLTVYQLRSKRHTVQLSDEAFAEHVEAQKTSPVWLTTWDGRRWWWYLDRFWWDSEGLEADDVQVLVLQRDRQKQATLEKARAAAFGINEAPGEGSEASRRRVVKQEEQERKQRSSEERIAQVEGLNAELDTTISALETLLSRRDGPHVVRCSADSRARGSVVGLVLAAAVADPARGSWVG